MLNYSLDDGATWHVYEGRGGSGDHPHLANASVGTDLHHVEHTMLKVDHGWRLTLEACPDNQYLAGGDQALIDGLEGGHDFRTGEWQGFWGKPMVARIDLGRVCDVQQRRSACPAGHQTLDLGPASHPVLGIEGRFGFRRRRTGRRDCAEDDTEVQIVTTVGTSPFAPVTLKSQRRPMPPFPIGIWARQRPVDVLGRDSAGDSIAMNHADNPFLSQGWPQRPSTPWT